MEHPLLDLIKLRMSQINSCAYCLDMHWKDLKVAGETDQRLYSLDAWRETPFYTDRERAALTWAEAVTRISPEKRPGIHDSPIMGFAMCGSERSVPLKRDQNIASPSFRWPAILSTMM